MMSKEPIEMQGRGECRWTWGMTFVLLFAGILCFARLGERSLWSEEVRWAEIPREMVLNADYFQPTINGRSYYDKPLGSYWLVILASGLTGGVNELAARLPSALSGWLGVLFLMLIARKLYSSRVASVSGLVLATSFSFLFFSRHASTDVETIAGVLAVLWVFLVRPFPLWANTLLIWELMALTSLTKGLLGFVLPIMVIGIYSSLTPYSESDLEPNPDSTWNILGIIWNRNAWFFNRFTLLALPLALVTYFLPFAVSIAGSGTAEGLQMVFRENIRRFFAPVNHKGPPYLYFYIIFLLFAPWSILLPAALIQVAVLKRKEGLHINSDRFILVFFWSILIFFTLASSRRSYYLLPILPSSALLIARMLTSGFRLEKVAEILIRLTRYFMVFLIGTAIIVLAGLPWLKSGFSILGNIPFPFTLALVLVFCLWQWIRSWRSIRVIDLGKAMGVTAVAGMVYGYLVLWPQVDSLRTQRPFAQKVLELPGMDPGLLALYRNRDIVYYLGQTRPIMECHQESELDVLMKEKQVRWVIIRERDRKRIGVPGKELIREESHEWEDSGRKESKLILLEIDNQA